MDVNGDSMFPIGVAGGKPAAITKGGQDDDISDWDEVWKTIRHAHTRLYLAYDPSGKTNAVFLKKASEDGDGTEWLVVHAAEPMSYVIRAAGGPHKGWYLDYSKEVVDLGNGVKGHLLILSEKPGNIKKVQIDDISP